MKYKKYSRYSIENPEVWGELQKKDAPKDVEFLIKLFKKYGKVKSVLDVGCGIGAHINLLTKKGYNCFGVDANPEMIKYAKKNFPNLKFEVQFMQNLKIKDKFDAVICIGNIIAFNKDNKEVLKTFNNFKKHLKKDGILIIQTSNPISYIENNSFRKTFVDTGKDRTKYGIKAVYKEEINEINQSSISTRTFYNLKDNKKVGSYSKESRLFFPQELKFFLEQSGFKFLDFYSGDKIPAMKENKLDKRKMLAVVRR